MGYLTVEYFRERFGDFEARDVSQVGADVADADPEAVRIQGAIEAASGEIDSALAVEYAVPLSPAPSEIIDICAALTRERLDTFDRRDSVMEDAGAARVRLQELADRKRLLTCPGGVAANASAGTFGGVGRVRRSGWQDRRGLRYGLRK